MKSVGKYRPLYFMPPGENSGWVGRDRLDKAPAWCSVDLRDGNQALMAPMSLEEKLEYYRFLLAAGFREIEIGFPAASQTEFGFARALIDGGLIPEGVAVQVLTQSRAHIIDRTFEAIRGAPRAIVHLYNSTSRAQREQVFRMGESEIVAIAEEGARLLDERASRMPETRFAFEYSPESFTGTEPEFALRICNAVIDVWKPSAERPVIINLPATVESSMPHVYAQQVAYMSRSLRCRESVIVSLHPHNDRGTAVAAAELGLLAGADRVEGTILGNGERTGNVDLVTLALNLYTHGVDPGLDFSDMPALVRAYERATGLPVGPRHPYAGELVFAAFSGSHQDAIAKGMQWRRERGDGLWTVPYLPLDPADVSREYETDVIRINSQSGKGGISYVLQSAFGFHLPPEMRQEVGYFIKDISDRERKELAPREIMDAFAAGYVNVPAPAALEGADWSREGDRTVAELRVSLGGRALELSGIGNGTLDAASQALRSGLPKGLGGAHGGASGEGAAVASGEAGPEPGFEFSFADYAEHALEGNSDARAAAYVKIIRNGKAVWGAGVHNDIAMAPVLALLSAVNRAALAGA